MKPYLAMGLFSLYIVAVSLAALLRDGVYSRLDRLRRMWGWNLGLALHFSAHVAIPLVLGILFLAQGIVRFDSSREHSLLAPLHHQASLRHLYSREPKRILPGEALTNGEIVLLLAQDRRLPGRVSRDAFDPDFLPLSQMRLP